MTSLPFLTESRFLRSSADAGARYALVGVPWDGATTNRPGARFGPDAIRRASHMLCDAVHPHFDTSPVGHLLDLGDLSLPNTSLEAMRSALAAAAAPLVARHHMVWLGGDHSITLTLLQAYHAHFGRPLAVVHFDAHCDTWDDHFGEPSGHGTWVSEAFSAGLVEPRAFVQIGIRSAADRAARDFVSSRGGSVHTARSLRGCDGPAGLAGVVADVRARLAACGQPPAYLSLDIDCLDPAYAPGTGTPEPGGLTSSQLLTLLEELAGFPFIGMDCVEVAPTYDHAQLTALAAAHGVWTYLCGRLHADTASGGPGV